MAYLELDSTSGFYRVRFRYQGRPYKRSVKTADQAEAAGVVARVDETIRLLERGRLEMPTVEDLSKEHLYEVDPDLEGFYVNFDPADANVYDPEKLIAGLATCAWCNVHFDVIAKALMLYVKDSAAEEGVQSVPDAEKEGQYRGLPLWPLIPHLPLMASSSCRSGIPTA